MCDLSLKSKAALAHHENRHLDVRPYECSLCNKRFTTKGKSFISLFQLTRLKWPIHIQICTVNFLNNINFISS